MVSDRIGPDDTTNQGGLVRTAERLAAHLGHRPSRSLEPQGEAPAAVLVPVFPDHQDRLATLVTLRTDTVRDHKGQISFPGGVRDDGDPDLAATALREAREEIGLAIDQVCLAGRLDDYRTMTGYLIRPFVGYLRSAPEVRANPVEIAEVIHVPLGPLRAPGAHEFRRVESEGRVFETHVFHVGDHVVWGATAAILMDLLDRIEHLL